MKRTYLALAVALGAGLAHPLLAAEAPASESPHLLSGSLTLTSDYRFRGISQTGEGPAVQGGLTYTYVPASLNAGVWGSNVDSSGYADANVELDTFISWTPSWDALGVDLGWIRYNYPSTDVSANNTNEFHIGGSYDFKVAQPKFTINYSPDWFGTGDSWYYDLSVKVPLPEDFAVNVHYGWNRFEGLKDYQDWSIGVTKPLFGLDLALSYVDTQDLDEDQDCLDPFKCGGALVFSVGKTF
jgi:uncharacterized protein (TIGR02001 family)